jgi:PAS domain S-box-containing protein
VKSIGTRFLLPLGTIVLLFSIFILFETYQTSRKYANGLLSQQAALTLEFNLAIRDYVAEEIRPIVESLVDKDEFIPEAMSTSFISRSVSERVRKMFPQYLTLFSSEYPRNPINLAGPDELRMIEYFRKNPHVSRRSEEVLIDGRNYLAHFAPKWMKEECMRCHGDPQDAPAALIRRYGATASFNRKQGDVAGLDTVAVPFEAVNAILARETLGQSLILAAGLVLLFGLIIVAFRYVVTRRLVHMAKHFNEIAAHGESAWMIPVKIRGNDEISMVGAAFNKLLEQLKESHSSLEKRVYMRTEELRRANEQLRLELVERKRAERVAGEREKEAHRFARENATVAEIGSIINSSLEIEEVYERFAEEVRKLIPFDRISINIVDLKQNEARIAYVSGGDLAGRRIGDRVPLAGGYVEHLVRTRQPVGLTGELSAMSERFPSLLPVISAGYRSAISVPLISKDEVIGIFNCWSRTPMMYSENELRIAARVGYQITSAIANSLVFAERREAEKALQESEQRFKDLYDNAPSGYHEYDAEGRITRINRTELDMLGYTLEEMLGQFIWKLSDREEMARRGVMEKLAGTRQNLPEFERVYRRKDGTLLPVVIRNRLVLDDQGRVTTIRSTVQDITERKASERALKEKDEEREKLQARLQRAQKMEAIGTLAGGVAHDLNNILSGLVSYPDLLLLQLPDDSPFRKPVTTILESGKKAAAIVQDLLTLARRAVPTAEVVNLNEVVYDYLRSPEHDKLLSFHPDVKVKTIADKELLHVLGSPIHLSKIIMNLVSNAAEAMPEGGEILISTENRYIESAIGGYEHVEEGDYVTLTVSDTGMGISPSDRERIFEPFYSKKVMGRSGTGLGMAVVWGTVKDHRGYIDLQSSVGKGTTFTIYFPVTREQPAKPIRPSSIEEYRGKGESILVVDDVESQREIASALLSHMGYRVAAVSTGEEAVEYVKKTNVDLIVLDMVMEPGMDGLETYKRIIGMHPQQKAVIASGFSETHRVREVQKLGAGQYIKKPYTLQKLAAALRKELEKNG